jgi:hypothetical protein
MVVCCSTERIYQMGRVVNECDDTPWWLTRVVAQRYATRVSARTSIREHESERERVW